MEEARKAGVPARVLERFPGGACFLARGRDTVLAVPGDALVTAYVADALPEAEGAPCLADGRIAASRGLEGERAVVWVGASLGW